MLRRQKGHRDVILEAGEESISSHPALLYFRNSSMVTAQVEGAQGSAP
tara:strand:- start:36862 stop:37005 length:144 start_codon:yes stop_codon:yes gene_type:complete